MPTNEEFEALVSNCTWEWTQVNSVKGTKFTGKGAYASNSVFLPASGHYYRDNLDVLNYSGYYWSSSKPNFIEANHLFICSENQYRSAGTRMVGESVRAVLK